MLRVNLILGIFGALGNFALVVIFEETKQEFVNEVHMIYLLNLFSSILINEYFKQKGNLFFLITISEVAIPHAYLILRSQLNLSSIDESSSKLDGVIKFSKILYLCTSFYVLCLVMFFQYQRQQSYERMRLSEQFEEIRSDPSAINPSQNVPLHSDSYTINSQKKNPKLVSPLSESLKRPGKRQISILKHKNSSKQTDSQLQSQHKQYKNFHQQNSKSDGENLSASHTLNLSLKNTQTFGQIIPNTSQYQQILSPEFQTSQGFFSNADKRLIKSQQNISQIQQYQGTQKIPVFPIVEEEFDHQSLAPPIINISSIISPRKLQAQILSNKSISQRLKSFSHDGSLIINRKQSKADIDEEVSPKQEKSLLEEDKPIVEQNKQEITPKKCISIHMDCEIKEINPSNIKQNLYQMKENTSIDYGQNSQIQFSKNSEVPKFALQKKKSHFLPAEFENIEEKEGETERGQVLEENIPKKISQKTEFSIEDSFSKAFFNFFPEGVAFIDDSMNILYANDSLQKLFCQGSASLEEKLFSLKNDLKIQEMSMQKSSQAKRFLLKNTICTDMNIQSPKIQNTSKTKSHNNILTKENTKHQFKSFFKKNTLLPKLNVCVSQTLQSPGLKSFSNNTIHPFSHQVSFNGNNGNFGTHNNILGNSQNNFTSLLFLQNQMSRPEQKSNTSLQVGQPSSNGINVKSQQVSGVKTSKNDPFSQHSDQNTYFFEEPIFQNHFPVLDGNHINVSKRQAILPDLYTEIEQLLLEIKRYVGDASVDYDFILDKAFTFTSHFEVGSQLGDAQPNQSIPNRTSISDNIGSNKNSFSNKHQKNKSTLNRSQSNFFPSPTGAFNKSLNHDSILLDANKEIQNSQAENNHSLTPFQINQTQDAKIETIKQKVQSLIFKEGKRLNTKILSSAIGEESQNYSSSASSNIVGIQNKQNQAIISQPIHETHTSPQDFSRRPPKYQKIISSQNELNNKMQNPLNSQRHNISISGQILKQDIQNHNNVEEQNEDTFNVPSEYDIPNPLEQFTHNSLKDLQSESLKKEQSEVKSLSKPKISEGNIQKIQSEQKHSSKHDLKSSKVSFVKSTVVHNEEKEWGEDAEKLEKKRELDISIFSYVLNGKPTLLLLVKDVTHRSYIKLLQDVSKKKSKMVSFVSHELRTPLNSIIAMLETMKKSPQLEYIETALMNSKYLLCISNDLLDLAQIKVNKFQIRKKVFNLKQLIFEAMEMFSLQAKRQQIELIVDYQSVVPSFLTSDKNRIRQVLINLLGNAFKFTINGAITIKARKIDAALFEVEVSDTGIGIKEQDLNKLFKTFGKLDGEEAVKLNEQGVGLGLVISNMIVFSLSEEQEGMKVSSEYNKGTSFIFKILDWDIRQSQRAEEAYQINQESENSSMVVEAEENEGILRLPIDNVKKYDLHSISKNKFIDEYQSKSSTNFSIDSVSSVQKIEQTNQLQLKKMNSSLKYSNTIESQGMVCNFSIIQNKSRLYHRQSTEFVGRCWAQKNRPNNSDKNGDYSVLSFNCNEKKADPNYSVVKLTKIATQINIKDQWGEILVVDDNMNNILAMKCLISLIDPSLQCNYAIRGQGAEDLVKNRFDQQEDEGYHLIFMDIVMPEQDGITTAKNIIKFLEEKEIKKTKIIGCSGYDDDQEKKSCLKAGMKDYISKPVFKEKLASILMTYM